jgi:hypothetical protein
MRSLIVAVCLLAALGACRTIEQGAAKDPRKCELDPSCARKPGNNQDCATACADNIACMERCHQVTGQ